MGTTLVQVVNTLNEKGLRYKAVEKEGLAVFQFGLLVPDSKKNLLTKEGVQITPNDESVSVLFMGKEKSLDTEGFEKFVDNVIKLKACQEDELKLISELSA
ncbi:hypothetical protein JOD82_002211 [Paenibacillus sp. 1182]|uniref:hypothetical protein n=1 Tax=Paenibacillus sp. 1182 TaxID=2806565 RepID=UPI001AE3076D|nr:hypothetical protein [Paenibacillus sp. 1182]MBP1309191.1 hypothetical protein [Paenibacillus sp. 1182]